MGVTGADLIRARMATLNSENTTLRAENTRLRDCYEAERSFRLHRCDACGQVDKTRLCYGAERLFRELGEAQDALEHADGA